MPRKSTAQNSPHELETAHGKTLSSSRRFVTGPGVCARYQITDMSLHRWLADAELQFPQPAMRVNGRRFWLETDLLAWERLRLRREALCGEERQTA